MSEQKHGKDMHYPEYRVSDGTLKTWAAMAKTPEERKAYVSEIGKRGKGRTAKARP